MQPAKISAWLEAGSWGAGTVRCVGAVRCVGTVCCVGTVPCVGMVYSVVDYVVGVRGGTLVGGGFRPQLRSGSFALHEIVDTSNDHAGRSSHHHDLTIGHSCPHCQCSAGLLAVPNDCCGVGAGTPELVSPCRHVVSSCTHFKLAV